MAVRMAFLATLMAMSGIVATAKEAEAQAQWAPSLAELGFELGGDVATASGRFLVQEWNKWMDQRDFSAPSSQAAIEVLKQQLEWIAARDKEHAAELRKLAYRLDGTMSKDEIRALLMGSLSRMDERLAMMARRIDAQQRALTAQKQRIDGQTARFAQIDRNLAEFYTMYPRQTPSEQAAQLAADGFKALHHGDFPGAVRSFRFAHATDPAAAEHLYGQTLAQYAAGEVSAAQDTVARGIVAERSRPLPRWFPRALEAVQGPHREFMETARHDPLHGVFAPGMIRGTAALMKP